MSAVIAVTWWIPSSFIELALHSFSSPVVVIVDLLERKLATARRYGRTGPRVQDSFLTTAIAGGYRAGEVARVRPRAGSQPFSDAQRFAVATKRETAAEL